MRLPHVLAVMLIAGPFAGCLVPENMTELREELGYASVELPDVVVKARATTIEPRVEEPVTFTAVLEGTVPEGTPLSWDFGDGGTAADPEVVHAWKAPGTYDVRVTADVAALGPVEDRLTVTVLDNGAPLPVITVEDRDGLVEGETVVLSASASRDQDGDPLTFTWEIDGGEPLSGERVELPLPAGLHRARLTAHDGFVETVTFETFGVALPLDAPGSLSLLSDTGRVSFSALPGASGLEVTLTHATTLGLDDVDLVLLDASGAELARSATTPSLLAGEATESLTTGALEEGTYTLEARLVRGLGGSYAIEGVLTYSPLPATR